MIQRNSLSVDDNIDVLCVRLDYFAYKHNNPCGLFSANFFVLFVFCFLLFVFTFVNKLLVGRYFGLKGFLVVFYGVSTLVGFLLPNLVDR